MSHDAAKRLLELVIRHGAEQNQALFDIRGMCSAEEFNKYRRMIGRSMHAMLVDVINPIVDAHPDLRPPHLE